MDIDFKLGIFRSALDRYYYFFAFVFEYLYELFRNLMKKYLAVAKATWQEYLTYRTNLFLEVIGGFVAQLVIIAVWFSIFRDLKTEIVAGYSLPAMITYLLGAGIINSFILIASQGDEINDDINRGKLSGFLVKPLSVPFYWLSRDLCRRALTFILGMGEYLVIILILSNYFIPPFSLANFFMFCLAVLLGGILHFFLFYIFSIIAFWMDQTWGPRFVIRVIMSIATGSLIPLSLFPANWQLVFNLLPFKFMAYFPLQIYLGKVSVSEIILGFSALLVWISALIGISVWIWEKGLKKYSAYGN